MFFKHRLLSAAVLSLGLVSAAKVPPASAAYLVTGGTVVDVQNTSSNGDNFAIYVTGGTGPCTNNYIIFPKKGVINQQVHDRGYQAALEALIHGLKIDAFDYSGASCANGGQVSIHP